MDNGLTYLQVDYRQDLDILICRWIDPIGTEQIQTGYYYSLEKAQALNAHFWLLDLRRRGPARAEDEQWLLDTFFPQVKASITGSHYFAYLVTPSHYQHLLANVDLNHLKNLLPGVHIYVFDAEQDAINWLNSCRRH